MKQKQKITRVEHLYEPYPYQEEALETVREAVLAKRPAGLVFMGGGLGKTMVAAFYVRERFKINPKARCLFLCHTLFPLSQAQGKFSKVLGNEVSHGYLTSSKHNWMEARVLYASFQTMRKYLHLFPPDTFELVVVDETHHMMANTFLPVVQHFKPVFLLGITMTRTRSDGLDIRTVYGKPLYELPLEKALTQGLLTNVEYHIKNDNVSLGEKIHTEAGTFRRSQLNRSVFIPDRDKKIAALIIEQMDKMESPRMIVFTSSIAHTEIMANLIPGTIPVHSDLDADDARLRLELYSQGVIRGIVVVDICNEAIDVAATNFLVFLRIASTEIINQQFCRCTRKHPGKDISIIFDFVRNAQRIGDMIRLLKALEEEQKNIKPKSKSNQLHSKPRSLLRVYLDSVYSFESNELSIHDLMKGPYPTWQEAQAALPALHIESIYEYKVRYTRNPRLPKSLVIAYPDYPGDAAFFTSRHYETCKEASDAAIRLGIKSMLEYTQKYLFDPLLPQDPETEYPDYPGHEIFFGKFYYTWQEAAVAAKLLGITSSPKYCQERMYELDTRLPSNPAKTYADWVDWGTFFGSTVKYSTWQKAASAAKALKINTFNEYVTQKKYKFDPKLPGRPDKKYTDFPSWPDFFQMRSDFEFL